MTATTWTSTALPKKYPKLEGDLEVEALIIGGGITGTTAAYMLAKAGVKVALIDKEDLSQSVTAYTTAFLTQVVDTGLVEMSEMWSDHSARLVWRSHADAIDMIEQIVKKEKIDCEFVRCDNFMLANDEKQWEGLVKEGDIARKYGFHVEPKPDKDLPFKNQGFLVLGNQAKFHPLKYLNALREKATEAGALIFDKTEAKEIGEGKRAIVKTSGGTITASKVLIATYQPFNNPKEVFAHKGMYVSYILELSVPSGAFPEGIYEDEDNPYHYFRVDKDAKGLRDRVILGGQDHRKELPLDEEKAYASLEEYWKKIAPSVEYEIVTKWSGPILETNDGLALIGTYDNDMFPGAFLATGFSGNGMTYGTIAAKMFTDFVLGDRNPWTRLYKPTRHMKVRQIWQKGKDYAEEFFQGYGREVFKAVHENEKNNDDVKKRE